MNSEMELEIISASKADVSKVTRSNDTPTQSSSLLGNNGPVSPNIVSTTQSDSKSCPNIESKPIFTCIVCTVQVIIFISMWYNRGLSPTGPTALSHLVNRVPLSNLSSGKVCWFDPVNKWIGPRYADLVQYGALYPPCMRFDDRLHRSIIKQQRSHDMWSGCCLFNNGNSCFQSARENCQQPGYRWLNYRYTARQREQQRSVDSMKYNVYLRSNISVSMSDFSQFHARSNWSGPACGLEPDLCLKPIPTSTFSWPKDDLSQWPICEQSSTLEAYEDWFPHMQCNVTGRPCCLGLKGECIITTAEHCKFVRGHYNPKASFCSQVDCLQERCGLSTFNTRNYPDQIYRVFTSLFIHSSLLQLFFSLIIQITFLCKMEQRAGWFRIGLIYTLSGCCGNLTSGTFVPYQISTGPVPALMGLLGLELVLLLNCKQWPEKNVIKLLVTILCLGFLPCLDNFANVGGLMTGMLVYVLLLPDALHISWIGKTAHSNIPQQSRYDPDQALGTLPGMILHRQMNRYTLVNQALPLKRKCPVEIICATSWLLLAIATGVTFMRGGLGNFCPRCRYFTCIPFAPGLCDEYELNAVKRSVCIKQLW